MIPAMVVYMLIAAAVFTVGVIVGIEIGTRAARGGR